MKKDVGLESELVVKEFLVRGVGRSRSKDRAVLLIMYVVPETFDDFLLAAR